MSSSFPVLNHDVVVPVLPFQFGKLKNLGPDLAKKVLPPDQFCHELGGFPFLIRVISADPDLLPLYGGVWGAKLHCNVVVFRPTPGMTIEGQCWDARNKVFTYLDLAIKILKPDGASDDTWQGSIVENGDIAKFVLLGYGNCKPLADFTPGTDNLRFQTNNFKPVPILYARFENDPPSGYTIPHGKFKPKNEPKASRHFTEEEVMRILRKAFKPPQLLTEGKTEPEITKIEKTKMQESIPRKRSRSVAITEELNVPKLKKRKEGNTEIELQNARSQTEITIKKSSGSPAKPSWKKKNIFEQLCDLDNNKDFCLSKNNESSRGFEEPEQKRQKTKQVKEECDLVGSEIIEILVKKKKKKSKADLSESVLVDKLALDDSGVEMDLDKEKKKKRKSIP